jgi:hypothetical protein
MSFRPWKHLKLLEREKDERVDFNRALGFEFAVLFMAL